MSDAGIYVHIPFCSRICPYCDFAVLTGNDRRRGSFVDHLVREIETSSTDPLRFDTIYFGGGTPSILGHPDLVRIFEAIERSHHISDDRAIHFEANPEDVTAARLEEWRSLGVGTLSIGVQSFNPKRLSFLGRKHTAEHSRRSVELAMSAGFATVSVDLIYGLPDDEAKSVENEIETALGLAPDHLSAYQLGMPDGTPLGRQRDRGDVEELADDHQRALFELVHNRLREGGLSPYEVSNFARSEAHRSRHNQKYWVHTPYVGFGPGAHSFDGTRRWWNERLLKHYERRLDDGDRPTAGSEVLSRDDRALETLMLALRTTRGLDLVAYQAAYGVDLVGNNRDLLRQWSAEGLIELSNDVLSATTRGLAIADTLTRDLTIR